MATTLKRTARTAMITGILSATALIPAMHASADPVTVPGVGTFDVPPQAAAQFTGNAAVDIAAPAVSQGQAIADSALSKVGAPYSWGAAGPDSFDCSGLVHWAHAQAGKPVPRTSHDQASGGSPVNINDLQPGDVVLMYSGASHAAIYIGGGQVVHALNSSTPVKVDNLGDFPFHSARRYH
ncbi:NlpC/P60 family protein [Hoyosella subflava]|uniref:Npl/p60 family secreted protein n=1 Tax=Hoyosella subflava (strain DSM 45089 / JCM 17490 / NBRC 109087 / DQS3-9A1) TaxID=443218 RepID=F6EJT1_HOYSD|nr:NlpC/P60 family protein [Hoyosella subflava]AEF40106.1 Npl/p60 family secreted protein [Hoyosella subflava DQS3-9A1]